MVILLDPFLTFTNSLLLALVEQGFYRIMSLSLQLCSPGFEQNLTDSLVLFCVSLGSMALYRHCQLPVSAPAESSTCTMPS